MTESKLYQSMGKAFIAIEGAMKDAINPHFKKSYADLGSVVSAIKPHLAANELWFMQVNHDCEGGVCVETIVCHTNGESLSFGKLFIPATKKDAQGYGSALTYARRYGLMTAFGVCPEDDDGNVAVEKPKPAEKPVYITDAQRDEIADLLTKHNIPVNDFCKVGEVNSLKDIQTKNFAAAKGWIVNNSKAEKEA